MTKRDQYHKILDILLNKFEKYEGGGIKDLIIEDTFVTDPETDNEKHIIISTSAEIITMIDGTLSIEEIKTEKSIFDASDKLINHIILEEE